MPATAAGDGDRVAAAELEDLVAFLSYGVGAFLKKSRDGVVISMFGGPICKTL